MDALQCEKRGYLLEPFRLFHLDTALTEDTVLVSMMHVNNELGTIQPVEAQAVQTS